MDLMEEYRDYYFRDCAEMLANKHSYKKHINKFVDYLKLKGLSNEPGAIDKNVIDACIGYYRVEKEEINTRSTMQAHLEALKNFYDYLGKTKKWPDIFTNYDYKEFKDELVEKYNLSEPVGRESFTNEKIILILAGLERNIDSLLTDDGSVRDRERYLHRIILRLFIKLTLVAPAKRNVITKIKNSDFEEDYKKLNINSVKINIPCGLSRDLINAIKYAEQQNAVLIGRDESIFEFIYRSKGKFTDESLNSWFCNVLKEIGIISGKRRTYPVEPIRNGVILTMVDNMVNPLFISKITGIGFSMLESKYYKPKEVEYERYLNKNINRAIAQNEYYFYI